jgi:peptidoglycan/xylan/chitin deacetylase (PgdA/CDA1 family)
MVKRFVNLAGSLLVRASDWSGDQMDRLFGRSPRHRCVVLAYHSVPAAQRHLFRSQMDLLLSSTKPVHADIKALPKEGGYYAAITFDDGLEDIIDNALPELEKRGIPSTIFIITDLLGSMRNWEHRGGEDTSEVKVMSREQLLGLPSDLVRIGSHTKTHAFLPNLEDDKARREISESRTNLETLLKGDVKMFSLPYGAYNANIIKECREAGYERVFTGLPVFAFSQPGEFVTGRVVVMLTDWPIEFRLKLAGAYRWLPHAYALKRRVMSTLRGRRSDTIRPEYS